MEQSCEYVMSVPDLEQRLHMSREWERTNKPKVSATGPLDPASPKADMDKVRLIKKAQPPGGGCASRKGSPD